MQIDGKRILLTCEHVAKRAPLDYRFWGSDNVFKYNGLWTKEAHPVDMAFARVSVEAWKATEHKADTMPYERLATKHNICQPEELLFFRGYAGENARYSFDIHKTIATGYCSQEKKDSGDASSFEIFWELLKTQLYKPGLDLTVSV